MNHLDDPVVIVPAALVGSRFKPRLSYTKKHLKTVIYSFLLDAQHEKDSVEVSLIRPWGRHLTGYLSIYVTGSQDKWSAEKCTCRKVPVLLRSSKLSIKSCA